MYNIIGQNFNFLGETKMKRMLLAMIAIFGLANTAVAQDVPLGDTYVLYFRANNPVCEKMDKDFKDKDVQTVVNMYKTKQVYTYTASLNKRTFRDYRVTEVPVILLIDEEGRLVKYAKGYMTKAQMIEFLSVVKVSDGPVKPVIFGETITVARIVWWIGSAIYHFFFG